MLTSPRLGLDIPQSADNISAYPADAAQSLAILDTSVNITQGTLASRPASVPTGNEYYATDTSQLFKYNGTAWVGDSVQSRRLVLQASGIIPGSSTSADYLFSAGGGAAFISGATGSPAVPMVELDATTYAVTGRTTTYVVRIVALGNGVSSSITGLFGGLYRVTATAGTGGSLSYTFASGNYTASVTPNWGGGVAGESTAITSPTTGFYALGANLNGTLNSGSALHVTTSLYAYFV